MINYFEHTIETTQGPLNIIIKNIHHEEFQSIEVYVKECDVEAAIEVVDKAFLIQMRKDINSGSTAYIPKDIKIGDEYVLFGAIDGCGGWEYAMVAFRRLSA